jgi:hypothetical protein
LLLACTPVLAMQGGPKVKAPKAPKPAVSTSKPPATVKVTTTKVKPVSVKTTSAKAPKPVKTMTVKATKPVKTTTVKSPKTTKATKPVKAPKATKATTTKSAKAETKKSTTTTASTTSTTPTTTETTPPPAGEPVQLTKVQEKLQRNTKLAAKLESRLPDGTNLMTAAEGFKNLGQFVAAVNVSNNHGYTFSELKTLMVDEGFSLGQAMQKLKAEANTTVLAQRAESDAQTLIASTEREIAAPTTVTAANTSTTTAATTTTTTTAKSKAKPKKSKKVVGVQQ